MLLKLITKLILKILKLVKPLGLGVCLLKESDMNYGYKKPAKKKKKKVKNKK
jgi:hypothetical protein